MSSSPKVLICHPGRQHSHQAAIALKRADMLAGYWTGIPCLENHVRFIPEIIKIKLLRYATVELPEDLVRFYPIASLTGKMSNSFLPATTVKYLEHAGYHFFDSWVAHELPNLKHRPTAVIAYENSALETFKTAKTLGIITILDAASIHHQAQDQVSRYIESQSLHQKINRNKDDEIELADFVLTVSELARQTYIDANVPQNKIYSIPLGANTELFVPAQSGLSNRNKRRFTFLFCGSLMLRKGVDLLLEAFSRISKSNNQAYLRLIGGVDNAMPLVRKFESELITALGSATQEELVEEYRNADCLILPSRHDSFGMVVAEALACGTPVIVSDMVGAKDLVIEGENGWVVPAGDVGALAEHMSWCIEHPDQLRQMREKARESAEKVSWSVYHKRLTDLITSILGTRLVNE